MFKRNKEKQPKQHRSFKEYIAARKERRERILKERANSKLAQMMKPVYAWMNRFSPILLLLLAAFINLVIETLSRHSLIKAAGYMTG